MSDNSSTTEQGASSVDNGDRGIIMCAAKSHGLSDAATAKYNTTNNIYEDAEMLFDALTVLTKEYIGGLKQIGRTIVAGIAEYDEATAYECIIATPKQTEDALVARALLHNKSIIASMNENNLRRIMDKLVFTPGVNHPSHVLVVWTKIHPVVMMGFKVTAWATGVAAAGAIGQEIHNATGNASAVAIPEHSTEGISDGGELMAE